MSGWLPRLSTIFAAVALVLIILNGVMFFQNRTLQTEVNQRQQFINESTGLARLNEGLVRALATTAYNTNDTAIRNMLHAQGIDYSVTPTQAPAAGAAPAAAPAPAATPAPATPAPAAPAGRR